MFLADQRQNQPLGLAQQGQEAGCTLQTAKDARELGNGQNRLQLPAQGQHGRAGGGDSLSSCRTINMAMVDR